MCVRVRAWQSVPGRTKRTETANRKHLKSMNVDGTDTPFSDIREKFGLGWGGLVGEGQEIFRRQRISARCRALHLQTDLQILISGYSVVRRKCRRNDAGSGRVQGWEGRGKQPDDPKCEVLPAVSHFAWLYKYRSDLRKRKSPAFSVIESTLIALALYFRVTKNRMKGNETEIN